MKRSGREGELGGDVCCVDASRRRHTRCYRDWSSDVCSSDLNSSVPTAFPPAPDPGRQRPEVLRDRKSTRLNSSHGSTSYADFCLKKEHEAEPPRGGPAPRRPHAVRLGLDLT